MKSSKKLPNYHWNSFSKSKFYCEKHLCLVMLFWNVQNQNKQKGVSRFLYQNNNKRLHFFTQISPKSFFKISVFLVKKVKSCNTFIYWEPNNKLEWNQSNDQKCKQVWNYCFFLKQQITRYEPCFILNEITTFDTRWRVVWRKL